MFSNVAIFTDLDGTLFNSESVVSEENKQAIRFFTENGGVFGVSTGRAPENAKSFLRGVPINGWSVVLNGAAAYNFTTEEYRPGASLDKSDTKELIRWLMKEHPEVNIQLCTNHEMCFLTKEPYINQKFVDLHKEMRFCTAEEIENENWLKILLCAPRPVLESIEEYALKNRLNNHMDCVYSSIDYLEFLPKGTSKGSCLQKLRTCDTLKNRTIFAIGDYFNDIELLETADVGVAVANAEPTLKAVADHIICSNDENSSAYLVHKLIPQLMNKQ